MNRPQLARLAVCVAVSVIFSSAQPALSNVGTATGPEVPELTRRTVVTADRSGMATVELADPLPVIGERAVEVTLRHRGRAAALALVQQGVEEPAAMVWVSVPRSIACPPCTRRRVVIPVGENHRGALPPGRYRVYLVAGAGRVDAQLRSSELAAGVTRVATKHHRTALLRTPAADDTAPTLRFGGATTRLPRKGLVYRLAVARSADPFAMRVATCKRRSQAALAAAGYAPGCPGGAEEDYFYNGPYVLGAVSADFDAPAGRYGQGGNAVSTAPIEEMIIVALSIPYRR